MDINENKLINNFIDLVKIDSPSGEENLVRDYLVKRFKELGYKSEIDKTGNLFIKIDGVGEPLLISAHMDTVEPGRGVKPIIKSRILKSSGDTILGADNKVALASILSSIELLNSTVHRPLEIVLSVKEETDGGINKFDFSKLKAKIGICPDKDAPIGTIVNKSPGIIDLKFTFKGKAAHAGRFYKGVNSMVPAIEALSHLKIGQADSDTTINIGILKSGTARNTVPEETYVEGEIRSFNQEALKAWEKEIISHFRKASKKYGVRLNFESFLQLFTYTYKENDESILRLKEAMISLGIKPKVEMSVGGSDANTFARKGIKVVNIGDGSKDAHTNNESISIDDLVLLTKLIVRYSTLD